MHLRASLELQEYYNAVYDILVNEAGANEEWRTHFITMFLGEGPPDEYRFQGRLGFGGKLWSDCRVTCYREDETPERLEIISKVNNMLKALQKPKA